MKTELYKIDGHFDGLECYVHARACAIDDRRMVMTMQKLNVKGCDSFSGLVSLKSYDGGKTWTEPFADEGLAPIIGEDGITRLWCDATHLFHKKTGSALLLGHSVSYKVGDLRQVRDKRYVCYAVYDVEKEKYESWQRLSVPDEFVFGLGTGCSQFIEEENGDLLIPVLTHEKGKPCSVVYVMRCGFDGATLSYKGVSNPLRYDVERGIGEGSLVKFGGRYYLTLRNDTCGLWSISCDGEHFTEPAVWRCDTGLVLPTYNTQSHLLICGGGLYLVYTRRAGNNDHVFRHRAPLFMAEIDTDNMAIKMQTERIVIPERGARLGNFGVTQFNDDHAMIIAAEWMQPAGCEDYGSDNSIFLCDVKA